MTTTSIKKTIPGLDILKFVLAILIVSSHCSLFSEYPNLQTIWNSLTSIAVPVFFSISSYFFFTKIYKTSSSSKQKEYFIHYIERLENPRFKYHSLYDSIYVDMAL